MWSVILTVSLWPVFEFTRRRLGGRKMLAAGIISFGLLLLTLIPAVSLVSLIAGEAHDLSSFMQEIIQGERGDVMVEKLRKLPIIGEQVARGLANLRKDPTIAQGFVAPNSNQILEWGRALAAGLGRAAFNIMIAVFTSFCLFVHGESLGTQLRRGARRLGGEQMIPLLRQVRDTVKGVVYGSILTSIVQGLLAAIGFWVAGIPYPWLLGALTLVLSFVPFGPPFVWAPAGAWLIADGRLWPGILLLVWGAGVVSTIDNVLRPFFIGKAAEIPVLLVFMGVVGGLAQFGMIGLFIGPVVLAVAMSLWRTWIDLPAESSDTMVLPIQENASAKKV